MNVGRIVQKVTQRLFPLPPPPNRETSTKEDAQKRKAIARNLERQARVLGVDVELERAGRFR